MVRQHIVIRRGWLGSNGVSPLLFFGGSLRSTPATHRPHPQPIPRRRFGLRILGERRVGDDDQFSGSTVAAISVAISPVMPIKMLMGVTKRKPSASVMPLILQITQNPLSFIQAIGFDPQPMASAR